MTPEQESQFRDYGCACRCLLAIAAQRGFIKTKEEFIDQYSKKYPFWERLGKCGITDVGMVLDIAREMNLASSLHIYISKEKVRERIKSKTVKYILLFTEKESINGAPLSEFFHSSLVVSSLPEDDNWYRAQVDDKIQVSRLEKLSDRDIDDRSGYFLLLS